MSVFDASKAYLKMLVYDISSFLAYFLLFVQFLPLLIGYLAGGGKLSDYTYSQAYGVNASNENIF